MMTGEDEEQNNKKKTLFGKYEVGRLIGQGNFGRVYHGKSIETGESVAIKMMYKEQIEKEGMMDQIKREISVMRLVRHPNIVQLKEVMATKTKIYLIMEYLKGGDLFARVDVERRGGGMIKEDEARRYFQQLISAVDYCHSRGVSHRDLKLENLLLDENGDHLKVADFGLSALSGGVHNNNNNNNSNNKQQQQQQQESKYNGHLLYTLCGAPAYVAPEVLRGKGYDGVKADVWSCGVILYSLIAGHLPFQDENLMRMYGKIFAGQFDFPPGFPSEARRLISKILAVNPDKRITIAMIKRVPWFLKGFKQPIAFTLEDTRIEGNHNHLDAIFNSQPHHDLDQQYPTTANGGVTNSPAFFNAFEFISSMSSGFDLSNLFENKKRVGSMFTSKCSASTIMSKIEEAMGKKLKCNVSKVKDFKMKILGTSEGQKGRLLVTAEVFEVAPGVAVVEFNKSAGDTLEYVKFCEEQIRPSLKDIVWTWQGDHNNNNNKFNNSSIKVVN